MKDERRSYSINPDNVNEVIAGKPDGNWAMYFSAKPIRAVELRQGEICIDEARLREALAKAIGVDDASGWGTGEHIVRELFHSKRAGDE